MKEYPDGFAAAVVYLVSLTIGTYEKQNEQGTALGMLGKCRRMLKAVKYQIVHADMIDCKVYSAALVGS